MEHDMCDCDHWRHVEAQVKALLATVDEDILVNFRLCDVSNKIQSSKLGKDRGFDGIPNEYLQHFLRRPLLHLRYLFNHCLQLGHFPAPWKKAKFITLPKPGKDPKFSPNLRPISHLSTTGKVFENLILRTIQNPLRGKTYQMQVSFASQ
jgi:hypothetical protein